MKRTCLVILLFSGFFSCTTNESDTLEVDFDQLEIAKMMNPQVGGRISNEDAKRWVGRYEGLHASDVNGLSFYAQKELVQNLLNIRHNDEYVDGLTFAKGVNDKHEEVMIVVPVKNGTTLFNIEGIMQGRNDNETLYQLTNTNEATPVNLLLAKEVTGRYQTTNQISENHPKSYFIGRESLLEMVDSCKDKGGLRFFKAIKDDQKETLVVVPVIQGTDLWKARSQSNDGSEGDTFDFSQPCPNACDQDGL